MALNYTNGIPLAHLIGETWDGSAKDLRGLNGIDIWCLEAPASPRAILCGPDSSDMVPQAATANLGATGYANPHEISAVGRYSLGGNAWVQLAGTGGRFKISAR